MGISRFRYKETRKKKRDYKICYKNKTFTELFFRISIWEYACPGTAVRIGRAGVVVIVIDSKSATFGTRTEYK